jgi:hypothetical protein
VAVGLEIVGSGVRPSSSLRILQIGRHQQLCLLPTPTRKLHGFNCLQPPLVLRIPLIRHPTRRRIIHILMGQQRALIPTPGRINLILQPLGLFIHVFGDHPLDMPEKGVEDHLTGCDSFLGVQLKHAVE